MQTDTCEAALDKLVAKDFAHWTGLPATCTLAALARYEVGQQESRALLGTERITTYYRRAKAPAFTEVMKVWLRDDKIAQISIALPDLGDARALVRTLGAPDGKLDAYYGTTPQLSKEAEWVYAQRGLALVLSFDRAVATEVIVFAPTTLDDYVKRLRYHEAPRELPE